jgi:uncharacterized membrane protein
MLNKQFDGINEFQALLLLQIALITFVFLNIPIARQIVAFIYLSFVPGFIFLKFLKLSSATLVEKILITIGLSLAFLMFSGFLINEIFLALNLTQPLTSLPVLISLSIFTIALSAFAYRRHELTSKINFDFINLKHVGLKLILVSSLALGIVGSIFTNIVITSMMLVSVALLFV